MYIYIYILYIYLYIYPYTHIYNYICADDIPPIKRKGTVDRISSFIA